MQPELLFADWSSDLLVLLATRCDCKAAEHELLVRSQRYKGRLITKWGAKTGLSAEDTEDARSEANFWIKEAIASHDASQLGEPGACKFESFLHTVFKCRFIDYLRSLGRDEKHLDRFAQSADVLDGVDAGVSDMASACAVNKGDDTTDPVAVAERHEFSDCLNQALAELDDIGRRVWELRCVGTRLREIAAELGMTPDAVKHRWHTVQAFLRQRLIKFA